MLSQEEKFVLSIIRKSILNEASSVDDYMNDSFSVDYLSEIITRNGILLSVYQELPVELKKLYEKNYYATIKQSIIQEHEGSVMLDRLAETGFDCIALKGWKLGKMYPRSNMRQMADLDILIKPYDYALLCKVMNENGYKPNGKESSWMHDSFKKSCVNIETHKRLTDDSGYIFEWEKGIWERSSKIEERIFEMSPEDFYVYHFIHLYKDFLNGSLGLRRIIDTWLLQREKIDTRYIEEIFEQMGMSLFHKRMVNLSLVCMGEKPLDSNSNQLLKFAFKYGIYGTSKSYKAGRIVSMGDSLKTGKTKSLLAAIFLPYKRMKAHFPILKKYPILLPYYWLVRIIRFLRGDTKKHREMLDYSHISEEDYDEFKAYMKAGGC